METMVRPFLGLHFRQGPQIRRWNHLQFLVDTLETETRVEAVMVKSKAGQKHPIMEEGLLKDTSEKWMLTMVKKELMIVDKRNRMVVVVQTEDKD